MDYYITYRITGSAKVYRQGPFTDDDVDEYMKDIGSYVHVHDVRMICDLYGDVRAAGADVEPQQRIMEGTEIRA